VSRNIEVERGKLKRRASEIEDTFVATARHIRALHKDLLAFQARMEQRFDQVLGRPDQVSGRFDKIDGKFDRIERGLRGLRADIPKVVRRALRETRRQSPGVVVRTK
jgi:hypothetical protein